MFRGRRVHSAQERLTDLGWEASVGEGHDCPAARLQHPMHLLEHLQGPGQIVHRDAVGDHVKAVAVIGQDRVGVEVLDGDLCQLAVPLEFLLEVESDPRWFRGPAGVRDGF